MSVPDRAATRDGWETLAASAREAGASLIKNLAIPKPFPDPALEAQFLEDHAQRFCAFRRASALLALAVWTSFVWWDISFAHQHHALDGFIGELVTLRLLGVVLLLWVGMLTLRPSFRQHAVAHRVIFTGVYGVLFVLLLMVVRAPQPYNYTQYFIGFHLAIFFQYSFFYLKSRTAFTASVVTLSSMIVLQIMGKFLAPEDFSAGMFYLLNVIVVGHGVCVHAERVSRERYSAERALASLNSELLMTNLELERRNQDLQESKKDQDTKTQALLALREQQMHAAETASKDKSNFLAAATHDLRQPMHALNLFLQAAVEALRHEDFAEAARLINESGRSSEILARLLNAVLDLSRLESGRVVPRYHVFDLNPVVLDAVEQLRPAATLRGVELRVRLPKETIVCVRSDAHWLGRAVANLVANGIKYANYSAETPAVIVGVVRSATRARIDVVDNGVGIAPQHWDAIFQPFFQIGNPEQDRDKGLGLGLSIVNAVISMLEEHRIELKSAEGRGSRFSVELPVCGTAAEQPAAPVPALGAASGATLEGLYVMLVEDDGLVRASTEALLLQWGVLFDSASSYEEFETLLDEVERFPDLVITDFRLRDFKTAREIAMLATAKLGRPCPCLVVTGEPSATIVPLACAHDISSKPVSPAALRSLILSLVGGEASAPLPQ